MPLATLFFDVDDTLYAGGNCLWEAIGARMLAYMVERLGLPAGEAPAIRRAYYERYGTTLRGLQANYTLDVDDYLAYVHDVPLEQFIGPAPALRDLVLSLPQRRWLFTNADRDHAGRVVRILGLEGCFDGLIDIRSLDFICKPDLQAYCRALELAGEGDPRRCLLIDDSPANLAPARALGFTTALIRPSGEPHPAADYTLRSVLELRTKMPVLWQVED